MKRLLKLLRERIRHKTVLVEVPGDLIQVAAQLIDLSKLGDDGVNVMDQDRLLPDFLIRGEGAPLSGLRETRLLRLGQCDLIELLRNPEAHKASFGRGIKFFGSCHGKLLFTRKREKLSHENETDGNRVRTRDWGAESPTRGWKGKP